MLVENFTVLENIILGFEEKTKAKETVKILKIFFIPKIPLKYEL
jgi:ABC-type uncharacterized transport system ATPase subunit